MTEQEAIASLAGLVAEVAGRCWEALGTDRAGAIQRQCFVIAEEFGANEVDV